MVAFSQSFFPMWNIPANTNKKINKNRATTANWHDAAVCYCVYKINIMANHFMAQQWSCQGFRRNSEDDGLWVSIFIVRRNWGLVNINFKYHKIEVNWQKFSWERRERERRFSFGHNFNSIFVAVHWELVHWLPSGSFLLRWTFSTLYNQSLPLGVPPRSAHPIFKNLMTVTLNIQHVGCVSTCDLSLRVQGRDFFCAIKRLRHTASPVQ